VAVRLKSAGMKSRKEKSPLMWDLARPSPLFIGRDVADGGINHADAFSVRLERGVQCILDVVRDKQEGAVLQRHGAGHTAGESGVPATVKPAAHDARELVEMSGGGVENAHSVCLLTRSTGVIGLWPIRSPAPAKGEVSGGGCLRRFRVAEPVSVAAPPWRSTPIDESA